MSCRCRRCRLVTWDEMTAAEKSAHVAKCLERPLLRSGWDETEAGDAPPWWARVSRTGLFLLGFNAGVLVATLMSFFWRWLLG